MGHHDLRLHGKSGVLAGTSVKHSTDRGASVDTTAESSADHGASAGITTERHGESDQRKFPEIAASSVNPTTSLAMLTMARPN